MVRTHLIDGNFTTINLVNSTPTHKTHQNSISNDDRLFLVVVDDSEELERVLYYACRRAQQLGCRIALMYYNLSIEDNYFMSFLGIRERLIKEEREKAEFLLANLSEKANRWSGKIPIIIIEQNIQKAIPRLLKQENIIAIVQAMPMSGAPLRTWSSYLLQSSIHIPVMMVPTTMTIEEINRLA